MKVSTPWVSILSVGAIGLLLSAGCGAQQATNEKNTAKQTSSKSESTTKEQWSSPPKMQIDVNKQYDAVFHTNYGDFTVKLFAKDSPKTVNNFVFLANHHFYHNDTFFRIMKTFMIQTGDPGNNGTGGPGYQFADELPPKRPYAPGIVAMANAGPNTNGSQFFICTGQDSENLNQQPAYTQFGQVTKGMNVVEKIASIPVTTNPQSQENSLPTKTASIESISIEVH